MVKQPQLFFEDLQPGQEFRTSRYRMTVRRISGFAREYDPQPMHLDREAAASGPFGQLTAKWLANAQRGHEIDGRGAAAGRNAFARGGRG